MRKEEVQMEEDSEQFWSLRQFWNKHSHHNSEASAARPALKPTKNSGNKRCIGRKTVNSHCRYPHQITVMKSSSLSDRLNAIWFHQIWVSFDLWEVLEMGLCWISGFEGIWRGRESTLLKFSFNYELLFKGTFLTINIKKFGFSSRRKTFQ
jgi:hypothetical protein